MNELFSSDSYTNTIERDYDFYCMWVYLKINLKPKYWVLIGIAVLAIPFIHTNNQFLAEQEVKNAEKLISDTERFEKLEEERKQTLESSETEDKVKAAIANNVDTSNDVTCMEIASNISGGDFDIYQKALTECQK
ncbi:hypothetical protein AAA799E16_00085 [Marine Group I thaumarchaeote SCGC AAA799-E16]|uniref:Uncharacterized protein n=5 Tax=Marine Group I TaxID=905826 RepID=A0A087S771_9ARCH|nr:hypothetical protein AAA799N04_01532 [Marine Group I thaumarchaeote SCGC AAA799-N04]KER07140.1 hypothetical protein AAA799E16_00085 [Marine Group I thaumarchaeote SCGC AAA799-E16]KFM17324.1 hypothetical protein AAA799D11_00116 [Marine Group I thaumarchaeote SCGC AAA799-D11]KFM19345.1 hypothetical protein SCCGRSA3_00488 [Marine Group I thaumarchaeote SCGC RSA3]KFM21575.1 hypothetical protein AAA799B03_00832 [Marine Group I thaumarchaeote SCGC AAA799-B03]